MSTDTRPTTEPRSRRAILAGALSGLAGLIGSRFANPDVTKALAGGPVLMGAANDAGTSNTSLTTSSTGTALLITQNGSGTALRGSAVGAGSIAGFFTASNGTGISGVTGAPGSYGVFAQNNGAPGTAGALRASGGNNHGVVATTASANASAVVAANTAGSVGTGAAVQGDGGSSNTGVRGTSGTGVGVNGVSSGYVGVYGSSTSSVGVAGFSTSSSGASGDSTSGIGVDGSSVSNIGVRGASSSSWGVYGNSGSSIGVHGNSGSNRGVDGYSGSSYGVYGESGGSGAGTAGVYGVGNTYALFGFGDGAVTGSFACDTIIKSNGSFRIDHPLDPSQKYLQHSFVESPDMKNVYDGLATLDAAGEARVSLPSYFDTLNRDTRIQLTAIGSFSPLFVKEEVTKGRFSIAGGTTGQRVYWQVTGSRKDPWAEAHPIVVELPKKGTERGTYLHPELYGQPKEKGLHWPNRPKSREPVPGKP